MNKKFSAVLVLFVVLALALSACQSAPKATASATTSATEAAATQVAATAVATEAAPVTLRFTVWTGNEAHLAMLKSIADAYTALHPNVTVQYDTIDFDDYVSKVTIQLAGGTPPDAGWLMETAAPSFVDAGVLADLKPTLTSYADYDFADLSAPTLKLWQSGDALYGVPFSNSPIFLVYNKDLFTKAGVSSPADLIASNTWTWENLAKISKELTDKGPAGTYGFVGFDSAMFTTQPWSTLVPVIWAYGGNTWSEDGKTCEINQPAAVQAIQLIHDMTFVDKSIVPAGEKTVFASGTVGMTLAQLSRLTQLKDAGFSYGIAPLPAGPVATPSVIGQAAIVVFDKSPNKAIAEDFVAFMTTKENFAKMAAFFPPTRVSTLDSGVLATNNPDLDPAQVEAAITNSIKNGNVIPSHVNFAKIDLAMRAEFDKLWTADAKVQDVLNAACTDSAAYFN
jgi:multiple sugar transport system substrate-binding protein